jgi:hypothetical protein
MGKTVQMMPFKDVIYIFYQEMAQASNRQEAGEG